jgi:hypothetical protein
MLVTLIARCACNITQPAGSYVLHVDSVDRHSDSTDRCLPHTYGTSHSNHIVLIITIIESSVCGVLAYDR